MPGAIMFLLGLFCITAGALPAKLSGDELKMLKMRDSSLVNGPSIRFDDYVTNKVVETEWWLDAGTSDFFWTATVTPRQYSAKGIIFGKDRAEKQYGRIEIHTDGKVSVFGFGVEDYPATKAPGCSVDNNGWCSAMYSNIQLPLGLATTVTFVRSGLNLALYFDDLQVASYTTTYVATLSDYTINWRVGSYMSLQGHTGSPGENVFVGNVTWPWLQPNNSPFRKH